MLEKPVRFGNPQLRGVLHTANSKKALGVIPAMVYGAVRIVTNTPRLDEDCAIEVSQCSDLISGDVEKAKANLKIPLSLGESQI